MTNSIIKRARPEVVEMKPYSSARSLHKTKPGVVLLDANECAYEPYIGASKLSRYCEKQPAELVDIFCRLYDVSSNNMAITRGADDAIDGLIRAFCITEQDNIIICPPTFSMYEHSAKLHGAETKVAPLGEGFALDVSAVKQVSDENTKLIFICSPNNPTGNLMDKGDILSLCETYKDTALVVVDEAYIDFSGAGESILPEIENVPNLVVMRTLSKAYAAASLRCGMAMAHSDIIELLLKVIPPYPFAYPVVAEALKIFTPNNLDRLAKKKADILDRKKEFVAELSQINDVVEIYPSDANFVLVKFKDAKDIIQKCLAHNIVLRDQSSQIQLENCIRISMGSETDMEKLLSVLRGQAIAQTGKQRTATINRSTNETSISVSVNLDEVSPVSINTGVGFYDHMLEQIAKHAGFSLVLECDGDLEIDPHHTIEDCAIALGQAVKEALGDKRGIGRYGFTLPMDEAQVQVALDLSGRFYLKFDADFPESMVGDLPTDLVEHIFQSFAENLQANLHVAVTGENTHHMVEACFKGVGRSLRQAIRLEGNELPSTKGVL